MTPKGARRPTLLLRAVLGLERVAPALPRWLAARAHRRQGAEAGRFPERLGRASEARPGGRLIWVHAASVGEVVAARDLARDLAAETGASLLFTTTTQGGAGAVPKQALHQFAPVDTPGAVAGFLDHWWPDLGIFVEADVWPRLVLEATRRGVPLALVNARASRTRTRLPGSLGALLSRFAVVTAQDESVRGELKRLGLACVEAVGDLRASAEPPPADCAMLEALRGEIGGRPVWAAVSTHPGDEVEVLEAHRAARGRHPGLLLLWAPRHPARRADIVRAVEGAGLRVARRSRGEPVSGGTDVLVLDTLGETGLVFRLAPLSFLGGSFGPEGGHNPWEPASLGSALLSGPRVANHRQSFARLEGAGAARIVEDGAELGAAVAGLLGTAKLDGMREAGRRAAAEGSGVRARTLELLRPLLAARAAGA
ncbi:3-deoxy-D-manno-octulosonic-acid transferase [Rubellimicrobium mesophilum DSM 19309]|uniref:3-deoxy-D-manno-octulosonic acid transferase n=1 Tax=Rubellimicrobium mesophilum DSM 19309 TaxID=442562 RepID=A0A017HRL5_9RHOB|nr:3-deoxy-D-manno-octulosonic acid transferase [Rubellimicrobium mesophilum]EYD77122.1 3-deoxy-D-manno-octulosonic-acid transferase [Rubellimicrobium mesophilum DSM 19309]